MAKKLIERKTVIGSPFYCGLLSEMPQDAKDKMLNDNPKLHKQIFGE